MRTQKNYRKVLKSISSSIAPMSKKKNGISFDPFRSGCKRDQEFERVSDNLVAASSSQRESLMKYVQL